MVVMALDSQRFNSPENCFKLKDSSHVKGYRSLKANRESH